MTENDRHPAFPAPQNSNASLWRYLDSDKFTWLVDSKRLFMPAAPHLGDPLEGTSPEGHTEWWRSQMERAESAEHRRIFESNQARLSQFVEGFRPNYYVSCWHMNEVENQDMWRLYTKSPDSVAIRTTYKTLKDLLPNHVGIGVVRYIDYATEALPSLNMFEYIMHKHKEYSYEQEVRAVALAQVAHAANAQHFNDNLFESETKSGFRVYAPEIDVSALIHDVVLHPQSTQDFATNIRLICEKSGLPAPTDSVFSSH